MSGKKITIQTATEKAKRIFELWNDCKEKGSRHLKTVDNLTEQLKSCQKVRQTDLPLLKQFPDAKDRILGQLDEQIKEESDRALSYVEPLKNLYKEYCDLIERLQGTSLHDEMNLLIFIYDAFNRDLRRMDELIFSRQMNWEKNLFESDDEMQHLYSSLQLL